MSRFAGQPRGRIMRAFILAVTLLLPSWTLAAAQAAEVRCDSHFNLPQTEEWYKQRWPSGARPTASTCARAFFYGPINGGDYEKVIAFYRQHHPFLYSFELASSGGNVDEAIKIGRLFRKYLIAAYAPQRIQFGGQEIFHLIGDAPECDGRRCICASACALIWFGSPRRYGSVGLHRPQTDDPYFKALGPIEAANAYRQVLNNIGRYLDEMEVPKPMIEAMVATGSADIKWVASETGGLNRPPSLAEWADATCGGFSVRDENSQFDLDTKKSDQKLTQREQDLYDQLAKRRSQWMRCQFELLDRHRDQLLPP